MKKYFTLSMAFVMGTAFAISQNIGINTVTLSKETATACDVVTVSITGLHGCTATSLSSIGHSVSGSTITIAVQAIDPMICLGALTQFNTTYSLPIAGIAVNNYTVSITYTATNPGASVTNSLVVLASSTADAGLDTTYCNASSHSLQGNTPGIGINGMWIILSGSGIIANPSQPQTTVSNLGFGINEIEWTVMDPNCTVRDTVEITNFEMPSTAVVGADFLSCTDTAAIFANTPTVGTGKWTVLKGSGLLIAPNNHTTPVIFPSAGQHQFEWTIENGICPSSSDTLQVDVKLLTDTPQISMVSGILSSTPAPAYQWFVDGQPISGATSQNHMPSVNGLYHVLTMETGCSNGLESNEIELTTVGIEHFETSLHVNVYPNPASNNLHIDYIANTQDVTIVLRSVSGQFLRKIPFKNQISISDLPKGMYFLSIKNQQQELARTRFSKE